MFTKRNLFMLFGKHAIIALIAVGIALLAVWFLSQEIVSMSDTVVKNRGLADKLGKRTELFSVLARDAAVVGTNNVNIENSFVPADNILEFITVLESTALKNGAVNASYFGVPATSPIPAPFPLSSIDYQNSIALDIFSFINYLKDFEQLAYFTKINSLNITAQGGTGWIGGASASFSSTLYAKSN